MIVNRVEKIGNFTTIDNGYLNDEDLSFKAKGILTYLLSLPDDWVVHIEHIVTKSKDGIASFRTGLTELIDKGYLKRYPIKEDGLIIRWETEINESIEITPNSLLGENLEVEDQDHEKDDENSDQKHNSSKEEKIANQDKKDEIILGENQGLGDSLVGNQEVENKRLLNTNIRKTYNTNNLVDKSLLSKLDRLWKSQRGTFSDEDIISNPSYCEALSKLLDDYGEDLIIKAIKNIPTLSKRRKNKIRLSWFLREGNFRRACFMRR